MTFRHLTAFATLSFAFMSFSASLFAQEAQWRGIFWTNQSVELGRVRSASTRCGSRFDAPSIDKVE